MLTSVRHAWLPRPTATNETGATVLNRTAWDSAGENSIASTHNRRTRPRMASTKTDAVGAGPRAVKPTNARRQTIGAATKGSGARVSAQEEGIVLAEQFRKRSLQQRTCLRQEVAALPLITARGQYSPMRPFLPKAHTVSRGGRRHGPPRMTL